MAKVKKFKVPKGKRSGTIIKRNGRYYMVVTSTAGRYLRKVKAALAKRKRNPDAAPAAPATPAAAPATNPRKRRVKGKKKCRVIHKVGKRRKVRHVVKCKNPRKGRRIYVPGVGFVR